MHVEEEIPPTVPKDTIGDHKTYIVRKKHINAIVPFFAHCHSKDINTYLMPLQTSSVSLQ